VESPPRNVLLKWISFERLFCVGPGDWNFLTLDKLDQKIELLGELVTNLASLAERLPSSYVQVSD
jgi:hypothetical protein